MTLITPKILTRIKACPEAIEYFTGSFCISGSQYHVSGSENDCEFENESCKYDHEQVVNEIYEFIQCQPCQNAFNNLNKGN